MISLLSDEFQLVDTPTSKNRQRFVTMEKNDIQAFDLLQKHADLHDFGACPVNALLDAIGGKWKPLIIFYLLQGTKRFGDLRRAIPQVTQQSLTLQLRELEAAGLIIRHDFGTAQLRVEYKLTSLGKDLHPLMNLAIDWGEQYLAQKRYDFSTDKQTTAVPPPKR